MPLALRPSPWVSLANRHPNHVVRSPPSLGHEECHLSLSPFLLQGEPGPPGDPGLTVGISWGWTRGPPSS